MREAKSLQAKGVIIPHHNIQINLWEHPHWVLTFEVRLAPKLSRTYPTVTCSRISTD
jgi:hypothetical protein